MALDSALILSYHLGTYLFDIFLFGLPQEVLDLDNNWNSVRPFELVVVGVVQFQAMQQFSEVLNIAANQVLLDRLKGHQDLPQDVLQLLTLVCFMVQLLEVNLQMGRQAQFLKQGIGVLGIQHLAL